MNLAVRGLVLFFLANAFPRLGLGFHACEVGRVGHVFSWPPSGSDGL